RRTLTVDAITTGARSARRSGRRATSPRRSGPGARPLASGTASLVRTCIACLRGRKESGPSPASLARPTTAAVLRGAVPSAAGLGAPSAPAAGWAVLGRRHESGTSEPPRQSALLVLREPCHRRRSQSDRAQRNPNPSLVASSQVPRRQVTGEMDPGLACQLP